jgi:RHH-type proline utilization regulon transcriptional repressor/proline dehydrogenase/delta 1-pyrroline-5-carboxylate dehydrogenase
LVDPAVPEDAIIADPVTRMRELRPGEPSPRIRSPRALYPDRSNSAGVDLADRAGAPNCSRDPFDAGPVGPAWRSGPVREIEIQPTAAV